MAGSESVDDLLELFPGTKLVFTHKQTKVVEGGGSSKTPSTKMVRTITTKTTKITKTLRSNTRQIIVEDSSLLETILELLDEEWKLKESLKVGKTELLKG